MKKRFLIFWLTTTFLISCSNSINEEDFQQVQDNDLRNYSTEKQDIFAFGLYDDDRRIIDTYLSENLKDTYPLEFEMEQYFDEDIDFGLLAFENFEQIPFHYEGRDRNLITYHVQSNKSETVAFNLKLKANVNSEISFISFTDPYHSFDSEPDNIEVAFQYEDIFSLRRAYSSSDPIETKFLENVEVSTSHLIEDNIIEGLIIDTEVGQYNYITQLTSGENAFIHIGNGYGEDVPYALIALKNWEQVDINGERVLYFTVPKDATKVIQFETPKVKSLEPFQFFAFPYPYEIEEGFYEADRIYSSARIFVSP